MRDFLKYFFASLLAIFVSAGVIMLFSFIFFGAALGSLSSKTAPSVSKNSILTLDLSQPIAEIGHEDFSTLISGAKTNNGLIHLLQAIKKAKTDDNIKGIYIKAMSSSSAGMSSRQELRAALKDFKTSRKFIVAYNDYIDQTSYYLSSVADQIYVNPIGTVELKGLATNIAFVKGTLDKLGIKPEVFYVGQFKSATEPIRATKMSDANRKQTAELQHDLWHDMLSAISEKSGMDSATIMDIVNNFKIQNAQDAVAYKLVDGVKYKDEVESILMQYTDAKKPKDLNFISFSDYAETISNNDSKDKIAILVGEGQIVDGEGSNSLYEIAGDKFITEIRKVKDNDDVKAVVLRINSPGGSVLASENILRELKLLHAKKPVVVSMSDLAASGGYYIASMADSIFAMPNTITGSIGIFGVLMNAEQAMKEKLGVTFDVEKNAPFADFPSAFKTMNDKEKAIIQQSLDTMYHLFKSHVAAGRKMSMDQVETLAQGRVWTGIDAQNNGLVDAIGGVERAVQSAASLAKLNKYAIRVYPNSYNQLEELLKSVSGKTDEKVLIEKMIQSQFSKEYQYYQMMTNFKNSRSYAWAMLPYTYEFY